MKVTITITHNDGREESYIDILPDNEFDLEIVMVNLTRWIRKLVTGNN